MSHTLHSPIQTSLLCAVGRPDFCLKRFYYTIRNSLIWISSKYTSFGGNCNKISFSNLPALKTPVDRHPIGCHTRCTCHSKILYFGPLEDQIFPFNVSRGNCDKISFSNFKNACRISILSRTWARPHSRNPEYFIFRFEKYNCLLKTFYLKSPMDFNPTQWSKTSLRPIRYSSSSYAELAGIIWNFAFFTSNSR